MGFFKKLSNGIHSAVADLPFLGEATGASSAREANELSQKSAREQMAFQASQAQIQRDYETMMSNSAHQRQVADLKAAGLNPVLSADQGGASTPSVSAPSGASYTAQNTMPGGFLAQFVKVMELASLAAGLWKETATAKNVMAQTEILKAKLPKEQAFGSFWDILVPFAHSARAKYRDGKASLSKDVESFWRSFGLGTPKYGSRISNHLKIMNAGEAR